MQWLPDVWIAADVDPVAMLDRLAEIASSLSRITAQADSEPFRLRDDRSAPPLRIHRLRLEPESTPCYERLAIVLSARDEDTDRRVKVSAVARRWEGQRDPPPYNMYVQAIRAVLEPLLRMYNQRYGSRRRLSVQSAKSMEPRLAPSARKAFDWMMEQRQQDTSGLSGEVWETFYGFIETCHRNHVKLPEPDLEHILNKHGFTGEEAEELCDVYCHGRRLLGSDPRCSGVVPMSRIFRHPLPPSAPPCYPMAPDATSDV